MANIRVLLVDDHAIVREGYRALLQKQPNLEVVADAKDGHEAYMQYKASQPDVVVMDISMPGQSGLEAISRIRAISGLKLSLFSITSKMPRISSEGSLLLVI